MDRGVWLQLLSGFLNTPNLTLEKAREDLLHLLTLILRGNGGHIYRHKAYRPKVELTAKILRKVLTEHPEWSLDDYRRCFGWTARLLYVQQLGDRPQAKPPRQTKDDSFGLNQANQNALQNLLNRQQKKGR